MIENKSFCILPWVHINITNDGKLKQCCKTDDILFNNNKILSINDPNILIDDIINNTDLINIRKKMFKGKKISSCEACYIAEDNNSLSVRHIYNNFYNDLKSKNIIENSIKNNFKIDIKDIRYLDVKYGNTCNLKCRMCNPQESSMFNTELIKLSQNNNIVKFYKLNNSKNTCEWISDSVTDLNINELIKNIDFLYIAGGETSIIKKNLDLLKSLINKNLNENINLMYNTNLVKINEKLFEYTTKFKSSKIGISIDGINEVYEYIRYPIKWKKFLENFYYTIDYFKDKLNCKLIITVVVQILNLEYLDELFLFVESINKKYKKSLLNLNLITIHDQKHMRIQHLPLEYKIKCWKKINDIKSDLIYQSENFRNQLLLIEKLCHAPNNDNDFKHLMDFKMINDLLDKERNQKLKNYNLFNILNNYQ